MAHSTVIQPAGLPMGMEIWQRGGSGTAPLLPKLWTHGEPQGLHAGCGAQSQWAGQCWALGLNPGLRRGLGRMVPGPGDPILACEGGKGMMLGTQALPSLQMGPVPLLWSTGSNG